MPSQIANISGAPYYDDFDPSKKYSQILAVPGRAEQAREFTQIQTVLLDMIKKLSGALLKEGSIISGMDFSMSSNVVTVNSGKIYLDGIIHLFDGGQMTLVGTGTEIIGAKLVQAIITEADDNTLRDPAQGYANYSQPGAHRIKNTIQLTLNDPTVPALYTFQDGVLQMAVQTPDINAVTDALARRTYDTSGNYKVKGFGFVAQNQDANNVALIVDSGAAYVMGYNIVKPASTVVSVPKAQTSRQVVGEIKVFHTDTDLYQLNNNYAKDITQVLATVSVTSTVTRGSVAGGTDLLPNTPVVAIQSVTQGGTTYVSGTDYQLSANNVDWSPAGAEPGIGSSYTVVYTYSKVMVQGTDYQLTNSGAISSLDFSLGGDNPVDGTNVTVTYDFYLARRDRVYLDQTGDITTIQGVPDTYPNEVAPLDTDDTKLSLGTIELLPNSSTVTCTVDSAKTVTMRDIQKILTRLDNLEYNQAISNLDQQAMSGQSPTNLKGVFTDGFLGFTKADLGNPLFSAAIDIGRQYLLQSTNTNVVSPTLDTVNSTIHNFNGVAYTGAFTEEVLISQPFGTRSLNVNPYSVYSNRASLGVSPATDNWIDPATIMVNNQSTQTKFVANWYGWYLYYQNPIMSGEQTTSVAATVDSIEPYARQIQLTLTASGFPAYADNLAATIDGTPVSLAIGGVGSAGTNTGTVKADSSGNVAATFTIPTGIRAGARKITLSNGLVSSDTVFTSQGIQRTTTITNNTVLTYTQYRYPYDPVAQSFQMYEDRMVTSVNAYFTAKDSTAPVRVMIRDMVNGYPGVNVIAQATVQASAVQVDAKGARATKVSFDTPAWLRANTQYCLVIATESNSYQVAVASLAGTDMSTSQYVTGNPYGDGVLFTSSNNLTWNADQISDLKFDLLAADFSTSSLLQFDDISSLDIDGIIVKVAEDLPSGTAIKWEYKWTDGNWYPLTPNVQLDLQAAITAIGLRATLFANSGNTLSPIVSAQSLNFIGTRVNQDSTYVSKLVQTTQAYTNAKVILEANIPSGSAVNISVSTDDGSSWNPLSVTTSTQVDSVFTQFQFDYTLPSGTATEYRVRIDFSSSVRTAKPQVRKLMNILT